MTAVEPELPGWDPVARATEYYARIGRVVSSCALMEQCVFYLAGTLDRVNSQQEHAGKHGTTLTELCRAELAKVTDLSDGVWDEITALLDDVDSTLQERNIVVHSVAPWPGDPDGYAHRPLPKKQRPAEHKWAGDAYLTAHFLDELHAEIQDRLKRLMSVRPRAERAP